MKQKWNKWTRWEKIHKRERFTLHGFFHFLIDFSNWSYNSFVCLKSFKTWTYSETNKKRNWVSVFVRNFPFLIPRITWNNTHQCVRLYNDHSTQINFIITTTNDTRTEPFTKRKWRHTNEENSEIHFFFVLNRLHTIVQIQLKRKSGKHESRLWSVKEKNQTKKIVTISFLNVF